MSRREGPARVPISPTKPAGSTATVTKPARASTRSANGATSSVSAAPQQALEAMAQLKQTVSQLERELQVYAQPNTIGREPFILQSYFTQILGRVMQINNAHKVGWVPPGSSSVARR